MNVTTKLPRALIAAAAMLSLGSMGFAACGSSGPPSASSLIAKARPLVADPRLRTCTEHTEMPSSAGVEQVASCGSLRVWVLGSGMSFTTWSSSAGTYCGPDYVTGPGWVLAVLDTTVAATNRIASVMGGTVEVPALCAGLPTDTYAAPSTVTPTSTSNGDVLGRFGGTAQEIDLDFPEAYVQRTTVVAPNPIVVVPGAQAALQTADKARGKAPAGKAWLEVIVSDGQGLCSSQSTECSSGGNGANASIGSTKFVVVDAAVNGSTYLLAPGGDGGAVQMNALPSCDSSVSSDCPKDASQTAGYDVLVPAQPVTSLTLDVSGVETSQPDSNGSTYTFPLWSTEVQMEPNVLYSPPGLS